MNKEKLQTSFNLAKSWLKKDLFGASNAKTHRQALNILESMLVEGANSEKWLLQGISKYSFEQFENDVQQWMHSGHSSWFVHGDMSQEAAQAICGEVDKLISLKK